MLSPDAHRELIARTALFQGLAAEDLAAVAAELRPVKFDSGQLIFSRGDAGSEVYLVADGRVRLSVLTGEGRELSFAHIGPASWFGEIAMLDGGVRTADATAVGKVLALSLSKGAYLRAVAARPAVGEAMIRFLCSRIREADQQLETIALYPIEGRLARFFLASAQQTGSKDKRPALDLAMSQSDLALLVGASRPKVNTALAMLEASGAITRSGSRIVCDLEELKVIAGSE
jgi:CRP-like cAMP-binding protein